MLLIKENFLNQGIGQDRKVVSRCVGLVVFPRGIAVHISAQDQRDYDILETGTLTFGAHV